MIGVEANKPDAIAALRKAAEGHPVEIVPLKVKYPQGEERMLIYAATGRVVPAGSLPVAVGVIVTNVATAATFGRYLREGLPLIERIVTVTGNGIKEPKNLRVRIGTLLEDVIKHCGGFPEPPGRIILGGPMTGPAVYRLDLPVMKATSGILVQTRAEVEKPGFYLVSAAGSVLKHVPLIYSLIIWQIMPNMAAWRKQKIRDQ